MREYACRAIVAQATICFASVATHLTVSDLDRSLAFYQDALGLRVHRHADGEAALGSGGDDVLVLVEQPGARPAGRHAGLYHVALLYPSRLELAYALERIVRTQTPIEGMSDHGTHEAIYLPDPDGNGLELAADRPRSEWPDLQRYGAGPQAAGRAGPVLAGRRAAAVRGRRGWPSATCTCTSATSTPRARSTAT